MALTIESEADQSTTQQQAAQPITQQRVDRQTVVNNYEIIEKDYFVYHSAKESTPSAYDLIIGFQGGIDKIDLASMKTSNKAQNRDSTYVVDHFSNTVGKIEVMNYSDNIHRIFIKGDNYSEGDFMLDILGSFIPKTDIVIW